MLVRDCDRILKSMMRPALKIDYTKYPSKSRDWAKATFIPIAETVVEVFFTGGLTGGEIANLYSNYVFPSTAKKLRAARSRFSSSKKLYLKMN